MSLTMDDPAAGGRAGRFPGGSAVAPQRSDQQHAVSLQKPRHRLAVGTPATRVEAPGSVSFAGGPADIAQETRRSAAPDANRAQGRDQDLRNESVEENTLGFPAGDWATPTEPVRSTRRSWSQRYARRLFVTDLIAVLWAALGVHLIELPAIPTAVSAKPSYLPFIAATAGLAIAWLAALNWSGSRDGTVIGHGPTEYKRVIQASLSLFGLVAIGSYLFQLDLPRSYLIIMLPAGLFSLLRGSLGALQPGLDVGTSAEGGTAVTATLPLRSPPDPTG